ncbi:MAG: GTP-binding protein [Pseudomonadota bacterium]
MSEASNGSTGEMAGKVPVTLLTGYLGAGKTTLLNRILTENHGKKYAVIVNEFGEEGIDNELVIDADEEIFEMNNGCICCTVRGDLIRILGGLLKRADQLDGILIETTGLADPSPVIQTFFVDDDLRDSLALDAIVTMVDAKHFLQTVDLEHECEEQVAFADIILLNKTDLVTDDEHQAVEKKIRSLNQFAVIHKTEKASVDLVEVLAKGSFDLKRLIEIEPGFMEEDPEDHDHDDSIVSVSLTSDKPVLPDKFSSWMRTFVQDRGVDLLRTKGILALDGHEQRYVFQGVHMVMDSDWGKSWSPEEKRQSKLVFIGRNLDAAELESAFSACVSQ